MKHHMQKVRAGLGELGALAAKTEAAERRILAAASTRLSTVQDLLEQKRPGVEGAPDEAQDEYMHLVAERAQLQVVIGKAHQALGETTPQV